MVFSAPGPPQVRSVTVGVTRDGSLSGAPPRPARLRAAAAWGVAEAHTPRLGGRHRPPGPPCDGFALLGHQRPADQV